MKEDAFIAGVGYCIQLCQRCCHEGAARLIFKESGLELKDFKECCDPYDFESIKEAIK
jgi:hypothetical protein